jgi:hypothetical protein
MSDKPVARRLPTHRTTQTQNKCIHKHPCLEWDLNPESQCLKTVHALDRAATVLGRRRGMHTRYWWESQKERGH